MVSQCTCPDPKCRVHWKVTVVGGWHVTAPDPSWGPMPMTFHPDDEDVARWVASNHGVDVVWVDPSE